MDAYDTRQTKSVKRFQEDTEDGLERSFKELVPRGL